MDTDMVDAVDTVTEPDLGNEQLGDGGEQQVADTPQTVDIDGTAYTLDELKSGVMRQADYTRKTQDLAAERQANANAIAVWTALQEDPVGALEAIQEHFADRLDPSGEVDPDEVRWKQVETFMQQQEEQRVVAAVDQQLDQLTSTYGNFDRAQILQHALDLNIGNLEAALLHWRSTNADAVAAQQRAAAEAAATAAKQQLPPQGGGSVAAGSQRAGSGKPITSIRTALAETLAEAGVSSISTLA